MFFILCSFIVLLSLYVLNDDIGWKSKRALQGIQNYKHAQRWQALFKILYIALHNDWQISTGLDCQLHLLPIKKHAARPQAPTIASGPRYAVPAFLTPLLILFNLTGCISALTLLVGLQEGHAAFKNWVVGCWRGYLSGARCRLAYGPADATATHCLLLQ